MTSNQISYWKLQEEKRANRAKEALNMRSLAETNRSNLANERNARSQIALGYENLGLGQDKLQEEYRHNSAIEQETVRHNTESERIQEEYNEWNVSTNIFGTLFRGALSGGVATAGSLVTAGGTVK